MDDPREFTDSAGRKARYTLISKLRPGDVLLLGWRCTVERIERVGKLYRIWTTGYDIPTPWVHAQAAYPVELPPEQEEDSDAQA